MLKTGLLKRLLPLLGLVAILSSCTDGDTFTASEVPVFKPDVIPQLADIQISDGVLEPEFDPMVFEYTISTDNHLDRVNVIPVLKENTSFNVFVNGQVTDLELGHEASVVEGDNIVTITLKSQGVDVRHYNLNFVRHTKANVNLSSMSVLSGETELALTPAFSSTVTEYPLSVAYDVSEITIKAVTESEETGLSINGVVANSGQESGAISLLEGTNIINVVVTASDLVQQKIYRLTVTRQKNPIGTPNLTDLSLSSASLDQVFDKDITYYTSTVANTVTSTKVTALTEDPGAVLKVNGVLLASGSQSSAISLIVGDNIITATVTAQDETIRNYVVVVKRLADSNANLSALGVSAGSLAPAFDSATNSYYVSVANSVTTMSLTPSASSTKATLSINGDTVTSGSPSNAYALSVGDNIFNVQVLAEDKTVNTYTVNVTRAGSNNADLASLTISSGALNETFSSATFAYTQTVLNTVTEASVTAETSDANASIRINGIATDSGVASDPVALVEGENIIHITVVAQDGTIKNYYIRVTRDLASQSSDATLSDLVLSSGVMDTAFDSATLNYTQTVGNLITSLTVTPTTNDINATVKVNDVGVSSGNPSSPIGLNIGPNVITILVTAQTGDIKNYSVVVTRLGSNDSTLSSLVLSSGGLTPGFDPAVGTYSQAVANGTTSLTVTPTVNESNAKVRVNDISVTSGSASDSIGLNVGENVVTVLVTAQDNSARTYTIVISRAGSSDADLSNLTASTGALTPGFSAATILYSQDVSFATTSVDITPDVSHAKATVTVNGVSVASGSPQTLPLVVGANVINTTVKAEDNSFKTYTLTITRAGNNDADLANLVLSSGALTPVFATGTQTYTQVVDNAVTSVDVTATLSDTNARMTIESFSPNSDETVSVPLLVGDNIIDVTVTAEDNTTVKVYQVTVTRGQSSNANLANIVLSTGAMDQVFDSGTTSYTQTVANTQTSLTLSAILEDGSASMKVDSVSTNSGQARAISLAVGDNLIPIEVTAQDGTTVKSYSVTVTRLSNDASLSDLTVSTGAFDQAFDPAVHTYTHTVTNETTSLTVTPTVNDSNATVKVNTVSVTSGTASGAISLNVGSNVIDVEITAQDGTIHKDTIIVTREGSNNAQLTALTADSGAFDQTFDTALFLYTQTVASPVSTITITPTVSAPTSTVTVNGMDVVSGTASDPIALDLGGNMIYVMVSAQDGSKQLYRISVDRTGSTDDTLAGLTSSGGVFDQTFDAATLDYTQTVSNVTTSLTITPTVNEANATVTVKGTAVTSGTASGAISLNIGDNIIPVVVTAENGNYKSYIIQVTRQGSSDADLASLAFSSGALSPAFDPAVTSYTQLVSYATNTTNITPTVSDTNAFVAINSAPATSGSPSAQTLNVGTTSFNVVVTAQEGNTKTYSIDVTRKSNNADLRNLVLSTGGMDQAFDSATTSYSRTVGNDITSLTVTPTVDEANATVTVNSVSVTSGTASGAIGLGIGANAISVVVTAHDGNTKTYTITVTRASNDATLFGLTADTGAFDQTFSPVTLAYTQTVPNGTTGMTVTPTATDANATIEVNGTPVVSATASGNINLNIGENVVTIAVRAEDNTLKTYSLVVRRLGSNDATLADLTASSGAFDQVFDPATTTFTTTVPFTTTSATVTPTVNEINATVKVNAVSVTSGSPSDPLALSLGDNIFSVSVTAQDGTLKTYTVIMTRSGSSDATLSNLTASTGVFTTLFDPAVTTYTQTVEEITTSVTLTPTVSDINASVKVAGQTVISGTASQAINLSIGSNIINVVVTAQDESVNTYIVVIWRNGSGDATLKALSASIGAFDQTFLASTTLYTKTVTFAVDRTTITPEVNDINSTVKVNDVGVVSGTASTEILLAEGDNVITVVVTAADKSTKTYSVFITRNSSSNNDLTDLTLSAGTLTPTFDSATLSYTATVSNATASLDVAGVISDAGATMTINGVTKASGVSETIALTVGVNNIDFVVTASDTTVKTYTVAVTRLSNNANLTSLIITGGELDQTFDPALLDYTATVGYLVNSLQVTATVEDTGVATMTMNTVTLGDGVVSSNLVNLAVGENLGAVELIVTAQDGTNKTYTIDVTREDVGTFAQQAYIKASDAASANPGASASTYEVLSAASDLPLNTIKVAISGNYMVVGNRAAYADQGIAYIYYRDPTLDTWSLQATLLGNNTEAGDQFGASVAIDDDTVVIGAPKERGGIGGINAADNNSNPASYAAGAVYVFQRSGTTWLFQAKLKEPDGNVNIKFNEFGSSVAIAGDVVTVGTPLEESSNTVITDLSTLDQTGVGAPADKLAAESGAVWAFLRTGSTWAYEAHIKVSSGIGGDRWGHDIAMDGDTLVVSSVLASGGNGGVAVFVRDATTATWTQQGGVITAPAPSANDLFAWSVDVNANTLVVGAPLEDTTSADSGGAFVYLRTGTTWAWEASIKADVVDAGDHFGKDVSLAGDTLVVGAPLEDSDAFGISSMPNTNDDINNPSTTAEQGAAYVFIRSGTTWTQTAYIKAHNTGQTDKFGAALAIDGDTIGVAAPLEDADHVSVSNPEPASDNDNRTDSGAVYIFK